MGYVRCLRGTGSGAEFPPDTLMNLCPVDGRPVEMILDLCRLRRDYPDGQWRRPDRKDMWRFGPLLPLDVNDPADNCFVVSLGEGGTGIRCYDDHFMARQVGFRLSIKDEGKRVPGHGANPTESFKDRGMAMVVSMARKLGVSRLVVPTQGNAGDALAAYAVAAGLEAAIVMPDDTPEPILGRVAEMEKAHANIRLDVVRGTIREAGALVRQEYVPAGYFNVATFQEPGWRIEGKKTLGLELAEPINTIDNWQLPDVVIYPTGGGTGILGMWKAFDELEQLGLIDSRRPKMVAVQSAATAPIFRAYQAGDRDVEPVVAGHTIACGLNVPGGVGHFRVLEIIRQSRGCALVVDDEAMKDHLQDVFRAKGWRLCPEGAACIAALGPLVAQKCILPDDRVVAFNTASADKYGWLQP